MKGESESSGCVWESRSRESRLGRRLIRRLQPAGSTAVIAVTHQRAGHVWVLVGLVQVAVVQAVEVLEGDGRGEDDGQVAAGSGVDMRTLGRGVHSWAWQDKTQTSDGDESMGPLTPRGELSRDAWRAVELYALTQPGGKRGSRSRS